jgi:hypothetical protein
MTGISARMISPRMRPTPAPPQVASHRSSFLPRVKPRTAIRANRTSEQGDHCGSEPGDADVAVRQEAGQQGEGDQGQEGEDERQ